MDPQSTTNDTESQIIISAHLHPHSCPEPIRLSDFEQTTRIERENMASLLKEGKFGDTLYLKNSCDVQILTEPRIQCNDIGQREKAIQKRVNGLRSRRGRNDRIPDTAGSLRRST